MPFLYTVKHYYLYEWSRNTQINRNFPPSADQLFILFHSLLIPVNSFDKIWTMSNTSPTTTTTTNRLLICSDEKCVTQSIRPTCAACGSWIDQHTNILKILIMKWKKTRKFPEQGKYESQFMQKPFSAECWFIEDFQISDSTNEMDNKR